LAFVSGDSDDDYVMSRATTCHIFALKANIFRVGNACYHSFQKSSSSSFPFTKVYLLLCTNDKVGDTLTDGHGWGMGGGSENGVLRRIFWPKRRVQQVARKNYIIRSFIILIPPNTLR
jgi:hypothetical protein